MDSFTSTTSVKTVALPEKMLRLARIYSLSTRIRIPMTDDKIPEGNAERGREIIAQVRELEAADKVRFEAFAATITSKNKKYIQLALSTGSSNERFGRAERCLSNSPLTFIEP
jgi:hypothetical protein